MKKTSITAWDPFREIGQIQNRLAHLLAGSEGESALGHANADWAPAVDIKEDDNAFTVIADLPEVQKEEVSVVVEEGVLSFSGSRKD